jgi:hypothetical protein
VATKSSVRITIDIAGKPRRLLSASEGKHGDIILVSKAGQFHLLGSPPPPSASPFSKTNRVPIIEQRYSVHPSKGSPDGVNVLKHTLSLGNGESYSSVHYTKALRTKDKAAHLFTRCFPDMSDARYEVPAESKNMGLGDYDQSEFMLVISFYICSAECAFLSGAGQDFTALEVPIAGYKLIVLWSFLSSPSPPNGQLLHTVTLPPELAPPGFFEQTVAGHGPQSAIAQFRKHREFIRADFIKYCKASAGERPLPKAFEALLFYVREPRLYSVEWFAAATDAFMRSGLQDIDILRIPSPMWKKGDTAL